MPNARDAQALRSSLLDDLEEAHAVVTELVLLARQLWVVARDVSERVEALWMHLPNDDRAVLDELSGAVERLLKSGRQTFGAMMRRGPDTGPESDADILRRQQIFALTAEALTEARQACAAVRDSARVLRPQVSAVIDSADRALTELDTQFSRQAGHWFVLRELLESGGRSDMLGLVFAADLPDDSTRDYDHELANISRHMSSLHEAERRVEAEVRLARRLGASWVQIGAAAGITPQGAYRRWDEEGQRRRRQSRSEAQNRETSRSTAL
jgi:hypothetical protein